MDKIKRPVGGQRVEQPKTFYRFPFGEDQEMIAINIKKAREEAEMTQQSLGQFCFWRKCSGPAMIGFIETGKRTISANNLILIARATNKPIEFFYTKHDE